ncbi:MAG: RNA polymerase subunit sigma [Alphaproteobacteria bacterium]|uniref:Sigma-70 family RNA polymerase sigma factor n=2 Tax=Caulobacteraceae TaxID=76892 RepID=A0AB37EC37_9CAUL|nr:RNA polymerase subunit sigma [Brevundimonas sp.]PZN97997.1 MAG: RNA polymerase subunit sigma [Alphaproteobacteria bacterium]QIH74540.1 sigma-70 family RNA polymerase sigma factor [Brevundimonas mediterranea]TAJ40979.1 MAG: sigma-70 family RNA polymerase sigma factor [Brevundimonas sp.]
MDGQVSTLQRIRPPVTAMGGEHDRLIEAVALRRDREAFARLFEHFAPRLKAYLMKAGAPAGAAEDFAQDAMLTVWRKAELFDSSKARAATWIFTIARNRRLDVLRQDARRTPMPEIELLQEEPERPDQLVLMAEDAARLKTAMARLTADQIEVLRLAFFQDNPHSEIARRLDLPLGTVKSRIRKAMIKLRTLLDDAGGEA